MAKLDGPASPRSFTPGPRPARAACWCRSTRSTRSAGGERWLSLLDGPLDLLLDELTSSSEAAQALRQTSPFAGVLDPATRMKIWHEVRASAEPT